MNRVWNTESVHPWALDVLVKDTSGTGGFTLPPKSCCVRTETGF